MIAMRVARLTPLTPLAARTCAVTTMTAADIDDSLPFKALLLAVAIGYGTNFPVGRLMNEVLPAAAATSGRFTLAALALSPFIPRLRPSLAGPALLTGLCDGVGYCAQSLALVDTPAAKVSFFGALTVVWVPALSLLLNDGKKLDFASAPQVWIAAALTLLGIAFLELGDSVAEALGGTLAAGDAWAVVQAVGFGTSFYLIGRLLSSADDGADQVLPVTAVNIATTAAFAAIWAVLDGCGLGPLAASPSAGWLLDASSRADCALPGALAGPVGAGLLWTGVVTTALVRVGETAGLARVPQADAAVIVATEPLWAGVFGVLLLDETLGRSDLIGGALVVAACLVSSTDPDVVRGLLGPILPASARASGPADRG